MPRRVAVILNPTAGRFQPTLPPLVEAAISAQGMVSQFFHTTQRGDARQFALKAAETECDYVLVGGGDGTINEVVNGLVGTRTALAILPLGTANVLAREIGIRGGVKGALHLLSRGVEKQISLGRVGGTHFILMASAGFDASVVHELDLALKHRRGRIAYVESAWRLWRKLRSEPRVAVRIDDKDITGSIAVVSNGRLYGGRFVLVPDAALVDPHLHISVFRGARRIDMLRYALALATGCASRLRDITRFAARSVEVRSVSAEPVPIQADGDCVGFLPVSVDVVPASLKVLFPPEFR